MKIEWIDSVGSTNAYIKEPMFGVSPLTMVCARRQTAGRGQRGNSWESEPGKNLTFSFYMEHLPVAPAAQFVISEAVSLAMAEALGAFGIEARVKWPNDIYVGEGKICGILIENSIMGSAIARSVVGIGLNVNQRVFLSDAPNPVSMAGLTGMDYSLREVATRVAENLQRYVDRLAAAEAPSMEALHLEYFGRLWRADGALHPFREVASGLRFEASVCGVAPSGHISLRDASGALRSYAFKQIEWL